MATPDFERSFSCQYVRLKAKLKDGRTFSWTHWVPNEAVDEIFGIADGNDPYLTADQYAAKVGRDYTEDGIYHLSNGDEEYITTDRIEEVSTTIEKKNLTLTEIMMHEAHLRGARDVSVRPQPDKRLSLQQAIDTMDDMLNGKATLNDFFAKFRQPQRSEAAANTFLEVNANGYATVLDGKSVNIRPLFRDDTLFMLVEIRRQQIVLGLP